MAAITLKNIPQELHRAIKIMQMDLEDEGEKKTLEEIYIDLIKKGFEVREKEKPAK